MNVVTIEELLKMELPQKTEKIIFNHTLHKEMWNWLAENPKKKNINVGKSKFNTTRDFYIEKNLSLSVIDFCFACSSARALSEILYICCTDICSCCPLHDGEQSPCKHVIYEPFFSYWKRARTPKSLTKYAKLIRDFPLSTKDYMQYVEVI